MGLTTSRSAIAPAGGFSIPPTVESDASAVEELKYDVHDRSGNLPSTALSAPRSARGAGPAARPGQVRRRRCRPWSSAIPSKARWSSAPPACVASSARASPAWNRAVVGVGYNLGLVAHVIRVVKDAKTRGIVIGGGRSPHQP